MTPTEKPSNPKDLIRSGKVPLSVVPVRVLWRVALGMLEGACKYGRHNYRALGCRASVYFDATVFGHIFPWWEGEDIDPDSGLHHLDKAIASLMVLRDSMLQGNWVDDRPPVADLGMAEVHAKAAEIVARYKDRQIRHYTIADSEECNASRI